MDSEAWEEQAATGPGKDEIIELDKAQITVVSHLLLCCDNT